MPKYNTAVNAISTWSEVHTVPASRKTLIRQIALAMPAVVSHSSFQSQPAGDFVHHRLVDELLRHRRAF